MKTIWVFGGILVWSYLTGLDGDWMGIGLKLRKGVGKQRNERVDKLWEKVYTVYMGSKKRIRKVKDAGRTGGTGGTVGAGKTKTVTQGAIKRWQKRAESDGARFIERSGVDPEDLPHHDTPEHTPTSLMARQERQKLSTRDADILGLNKMGAPKKYTIDLQKKICSMIESGMTLTAITRRPEMPCLQTVAGWMGSIPDFFNAFMTAKKTQAHTLADEIMQIADESSKDFFVDENGRVKADYEHIRRSELRMEARKWIASKLVPAMYGTDHSNVNVSGGLHMSLSIDKMIDDTDQKEADYASLGSNTEL